ncbi:MAG: DUF1318 domain-containing protein [Candidatus Omnitrophica bacterium]|nr:DUF1318 domain-containing protein [Candidatus Omnitrophota bacterium]
MMNQTNNVIARNVATKQSLRRRTDPPQAEKPGLLRFLRSVVMTVLISSIPFFAFAATYDIKEMTPQVQQALHGRQGRYDELQSSKSSGTVGENNQGYVEVLKSEGNASTIVSQENADRRTIYHAIVEQNHLGPSGLSQVELAFAEVQREKARK